MINNIEKLKERNPKYIKDFMLGCTIEEKIDTHYVTVEIISKNDIRIKKANGTEIDRVDLILNSMWDKLFRDWNYLKLSNTDWFIKHIGYTIKMFYFPCDMPLLTEYNSNIRYIFDRVIFNKTDINPEAVLKDIKFPDVYSVAYKTVQNKKHNIEEVFNENINKLSSNELSVTDLFYMIHDTDNSNIYATNKPEGFIYKFNNKIYQTATSDNRKVEQEKSSYEFLLSNFIKYCRNSNYLDKVGQSYTKTVCSLFNDYIINFEKKTHTIENNIDISSIESPYLGKKFDISYEYLPDQVTKMLCQESELYKNIFKVLLANIRKGKDYKHCIFMSKKDVDEWNIIVKSIKIRNIYI